MVAGQISFTSESVVLWLDWEELVRNVCQVDSQQIAELSWSGPSQWRSETVLSRCSPRSGLSPTQTWPSCHNSQYILITLTDWPLQSGVLPSNRKFLDDSRLTHWQIPSGGRIGRLTLSVSPVKMKTSTIEISGAEGRRRSGVWSGRKFLTMTTTMGLAVNMIIRIIISVTVHHHRHNSQITISSSSSFSSF